MILLLLSLFLSHPALAASLAEWSDAVGQIHSFPCEGKRPYFSGSGLAIEAEGAIWVLSSEHVVLPDESACHEFSSGQEAAKLSLIRSDFSSGLALLKFSGQKSDWPGRAISLSAFEEQSEGQKLTAIGFPAGAQEQRTLLGGKLISPASQRAWIPAVPAFIEAANLPVEYGMSGGVLLRQQGDQAQLIGMLSHQVLVRAPGAATGAEDLGPKHAAASTDLALAIPAHYALQWMKQQMKGEPQAASWRRHLSSLLAGKEALQLGPLLLTLAKSNEAEAWQVGGADGSGIGGADGSGIGGGDVAAPEAWGTISVALDPSASPALLGFALQNEVAEAWRLDLLKGRKIRVPFLLDEKNRRLRKISSLAQFITLWQKDAMKPLALRTARSDAEQACQAALKLVLKAKGNSSLKDWLTKIQEALLLAENHLALAPEMEALLHGKNEAPWAQFYAEDFDAAVALETQLRKLITAMKANQL